MNETRVCFSACIYTIMLYVGYQPHRYPFVPSTLSRCRTNPVAMTTLFRNVPRPESWRHINRTTESASASASLVARRRRATPYTKFLPSRIPASTLTAFIVPRPSAAPQSWFPSFSKMADNSWVNVEPRPWATASGPDVVTFFALSRSSCAFYFIKLAYGLKTIVIFLSCIAVNIFHYLTSTSRITKREEIWNNLNNW